MIPPARSCLGPVLLLLAGCAGSTLDTFPAMVWTGVTVHDERAVPWLDDAVQEYVDVHGLPVEQGTVGRGRLTTEWFPVDALDPALAACPETPATATDLVDPRHRARYRFTLLARAGQTLFRVEAHWQKEAPDRGFEDEEGWVDCPSTGEWERLTAERLVQRARLMPLGR